MDNIKKTPIIINFQDPLVANTNITKEYSNIKIVISTLPSQLARTAQFLPQRYILNIPTTNRLELELYSTELSTPQFRYRVQYYNNNNLIGEQYWKIPKPLFDTYSNIEVIDGRYNLPYNMYKVLSISPEVEYQVTNGILYIENDGEYTIKYTPALTLHDVVVDNE